MGGGKGGHGGSHSRFGGNRGIRPHGFHNSSVSSFGHRHHHSSFSSSGFGSGMNADVLLNLNTLPTITLGTYQYIGNQITFQSQLSNIPTLLENNSKLDATPVSVANLTIVGAEVKSMNNCCLYSTIIFGALCIFPLCFTCCDWWKRTVLSMYDVSTQTYQNLRILFAQCPSITVLNLNVIDSTFNAQKAALLTRVIKQSNLQNFTFSNCGAEVNYLQNQFDDFQGNVRELKAYKPDSSIRWGSKIVF